MEAVTPTIDLIHAGSGGDAGSEVPTSTPDASVAAAPQTYRDTDSGKICVLGRDISLSDIVRHTGVSLSMLSRMFSAGDRRPSTTTLQKVAAYLGVSMEVLLFELDAIRTQAAKSAA